MNKLYRRCKTMIKPMIDAGCPFEIISYSVAYEFGLGFDTADRLTTHLINQ